ncbi:monocarboxylate transporter 9-like isoform X2 [Amblyomma americanum]
MASPDSRGCWLVAASAAVYLFFGMMLPRSESIMYVGFMGMLGVNREYASWPLTVAIITSQMSGPLCGALGLWISDRVLLVAGALLCALPVIFCALSQSLGLIIFLYGVLYGLGLACAELLPFTMVARHFVRYRGAAMGLIFVVASISGFVFPLVIEALRQAFEFQTVLLILGALELNMLFGCVFVDRVPVSDDCASRGDGCPQPASPPLDAERSCANSFEATPFEKSCCADFVVNPGRPADTAQSQEEEPLLGSERKLAWSPLAGNLRSLASPTFLHVALSRAVSVFVLSSFSLTIVDFGADIGLMGYEAVALVTVGAVGDLLSRVAIGFVLDSKLLSGEPLMLWSFAIQAATMVVMALTKKYWVLVASCFFTGLAAGGRIFAATIMVAELFDHQSLPLSLGVTNFFGGLLCLARPPLIGYARDVVGSYDLLYLAFAVVSGVFVVTWAINLCWSRCQKRHPKNLVGVLAGGNVRGMPG